MYAGHRGRSHVLALSILLVTLLVLPASISAGTLTFTQTKTNGSVNLAPGLALAGLGVAPSPRLSPAMAFYPPGQDIILFGGQTSLPGVSPATYSNETWEFSDGTWDLLHPVSSPSNRSGAAMTWDALDGYMLLFGGVRTTGSGVQYALNDTWKFSQGNWTNITPIHSPSPRYDAAILYSGYITMHDFVVIFGGATCSGAPACALGDTWRFNAGAWSQVGACGGPSQLGCGSTAPSPRSSATFAWAGYYPDGGYVAGRRAVLFGGLSGSGTVLGDSWWYKAGRWFNWTQDFPQLPPARAGAGLAPANTTQEVNMRFLLFGGTSATGVGLNDTWHFGQFSGWANSTRSRTESPPVDAYFGMIWDAPMNGTILFGGLSCSSTMTSSCTLLNETWDYTDGHWKQL